MSILLSPRSIINNCSIYNSIFRPAFKKNFTYLPPLSRSLLYYRTITTDTTTATMATAASEFPPASLRPIVQEVAALLRERNETISVAETAAGGIISAALLATPGASAFYKGGLTVYTLESRIAFAGWTQATKDNYQGPTPDVVKGLANHTRSSLGSTYTVSESGIAGPSAAPFRGDSQARNRIPGYVALAVSSPSGTYAREVETGLGNDREKNMVAFAAEALKLVRDVLKGEAKL